MSKTCEIDGGEKNEQEINEKSWWSWRKKKYVQKNLQNWNVIWQISNVARVPAAVEWEPWEIFCVCHAGSIDVPTKPTSILNRHKYHLVNDGLEGNSNATLRDAHHSMKTAQHWERQSIFPLLSLSISYCCLAVKSYIPYNLVDSAP